MPKKNKAKNPQQLKAEQAHQRNLYLKRIKEMMEILGCHGAFNLLGHREMDFIFSMHLRPVKIVNDNSSDIQLDSNDLKSLNDSISEFLKNKFVELGPEKKAVSYYDFLTLSETIHVLHRVCDNLNFQNAKAFGQKTDVFDKIYEEQQTIVLHSMNKFINNLAMINSDILNGLFWTENEFLKKDAKDIEAIRIFNNQLLHIEKPEMKQLEIEGIKRKIYRVGIGTNSGISWLELKAEELNITGVLAKMPIKVYIQSHTVERFKERLGPDFHHLCYFIITESLLDKKICTLEDGSLMFAVEYGNIKLGYLKASLIGDILLIRTFLFLTNNGTPEGAKLAKLTKVQKADKKYLGIDKLNLFVHSDMEEDNELKHIFNKAGCGKLFKLKRNFLREPEKLQHCAGSISKYLGLSKEKVVA